MWTHVLSSFGVSAKQILREIWWSRIMVLSVSENKRVCRAVVAPLIILTFQFFVLTAFSLTGNSVAEVIQLGSKLT